MAILLKNKNFAVSRLASAITSGATSLSVLAGEGARFPSSGTFRAVIWSGSYDSPIKDANREVVTLQLSSGDTFTATRAQEGTTSRAWSANDYIAHVITAGKIDELETEINLKADKISSPTAGRVVKVTSSGGIEQTSFLDSDVLTKLSGASGSRLVQTATSGGGIQETSIPVSDAIYKSGTPAAGDYLVYSGSLWVPGRPAPRNIIWQGGMQLWQAAPSGYTGVGGAQIFINDGWSFGSSGFATARCSIVPDDNNNSPPGKSMMISCTTAQTSIGASEFVFLNARVEGYDAAALGYGMNNALTSNLSMWINCVGHTGTYPLIINVTDGTSRYVYKFMVSLSAGWNYIQKTIPPLTALAPPRDNAIRTAVGICLAAGSNYSDSNVDAWTYYSPWVNVGVTGQTNFFSSTSNRIDIASVQWTIGAHPLPWIPMPFAELLAIAQRYYEKSYDLATAPGTATSAGMSVSIRGSGGAAMQLAFRTTKRATPTITPYSPVTGASGVARNYAANQDQTASVDAGTQQAWLSVSGGTFGDMLGVHWVADARA